MTDVLLEQFASIGLPVIFLVTFLSCLAVPAPASLVMMTAGAFAASGEMALGNAWSVAIGGALLGDQTGFRLGIRAGKPLASWMRRSASRRHLHDTALRLTRRHGGVGVFLSRWLFSPLGPYVNFAGGATGLGWTRFTAWAALGEAVWVSLYVGLGYAFADRLVELARLAGNASGFLAGAVVTVVLGLYLRRSLAKTRVH